MGIKEVNPAIRMAMETQEKAVVSGNKGLSQFTMFVKAQTRIVLILILIIHWLGPPFSYQGDPDPR